jgi:hypothetical protein
MIGIRLSGGCVLPQSISTQYLITVHVTRSVGKEALNPCDEPDEPRGFAKADTPESPGLSLF